LLWQQQQQQWAHREHTNFVHSTSVEPSKSQDHWRAFVWQADHVMHIQSLVFDITIAKHVVALATSHI
jgi:hypothetical protein